MVANPTCFLGLAKDLAKGLAKRVAKIGQGARMVRAPCARSTRSNESSARVSLPGSVMYCAPVAAPEGMPAALLYVSGGIELVGGALVLVGFMTRQAAFVCSGLMAAAYWMVHGTKAVLPMMNEGELAYLYCFVFLFIAAHGSGIWAIDSKD